MSTIVVSGQHGPLSEGGSPPADSRRAWPRLSVAASARWAAMVAFLMSTQYLVQPFVWAHWPVDDVLIGWVEVFAERLLVAVAVAVTLVGVTRLPPCGLRARALSIAVAAAIGSAAGHALLVAAGSPVARQGASALAGAIAQWAGLALSASAMYYLWSRANAASAAARRQDLARSTAEALRVQAELQSLRNQIDPHFLFNTLATVRRLNETRAPDGGKLLRHMVEYLRSTVQSGNPDTTLGAEVDLVKCHLAIVALRMGGRLATGFDVPDELRCHACPPLTLATLVENAIKHGIAPSPEGGTITVSARRDGAFLELCVADTGAGMSSPRGAVGGSGIGLANTRARLRALYGDAASLDIAANVPRGVKATIRLPLGQGVPA